MATPSPYLARLRNLKDSAERLRALAAAGDWETLRRESMGNERLFTELSELPPHLSFEERGEARRLTEAIGHANRAVSALIEPRLLDLKQLLAEMSPRRP